MHARPVPGELGEYFTTRDALQRGISPGRLRGPEFDAPFYGVRTVRDGTFGQLVDRNERPMGVFETEHIRRAIAFSAIMAEHQFFTHVTAAVLLGLPLPPWLLHGPIDVGVLEPHRLPRMRGVRGHQVSARLVVLGTERRTDLPVTSPSTTWAMLATVLRHPYDLIAAGDAVVREWRVTPLACSRRRSRSWRGCDERSAVARDGQPGRFA